VIPDLRDSPISRLEYTLAQLTGQAPENELAAFWWHLNGLARVAHDLNISDTDVAIHVTNALAVDCDR
jgi:hypothetical protein